MSKESYIRGFRKAAEAAGVDPQALVKYAGLLDWFGFGKKEPETFDPDKRKDLVAVSNGKGTFYVPRAWDEREPPTAWLKDTGRIGATSGLGFAVKGTPFVRRDYGSPASTTNSPYATWGEYLKSAPSAPGRTWEHPYWKSVVLPNKSNAYVPASDEALRILKVMAGPSDKVRE